MTGVRQAIVLAGGQALRMRPVTQDLPKVMAPVEGRPILEYQLRWLYFHGVRRVIVSCGWRAQVVVDFLQQRAWPDMVVTCTIEDRPLGRGGGLRLAAAALPWPNERFLALNGDVITTLDLPRFASHHTLLGAAATLALVQIRSNWGVVHLEDDKIKRFEQSPLLPYWGSSGIYCVEPEVVPLLPESGDWEDTTLPALATAGRLAGFKVDAYLRCMDSVKDLEEASRDVRSGVAVPKSVDP